jgi:general L-amino acid transport system substrate-binding protein
MRKIGVVMLAFLLFLAGSAFASTKDEVVRKGILHCGVSAGIPGFSNPDQKGNWTGLNVDICRAVATAVLGNASKVKFTPVTEKEGYTSLLSGDIDILMSNTPWTYTRDTALGLGFVGISYFDGQGFLIAKKAGIKTVADMNGATVCLRAGTSEESSLAQFFKQHLMDYKPLVVDSIDKAVKGFEEGSCSVITGAQSRLYGIRLKLGKPEAASIFPNIISKEPLGPIVRQGDDGWFNIVKWTLFAMIDAEELGITSSNIDQMKKSKDPGILSFIGKDGAKGISLGLHDDWAFQIVKQVGNYGESFEKNIGQTSPLRGERGLNTLWKKGGLLYAPPFR